MTDQTKKEARGRLKRAVAQTAPAIAGALGGPLAGAAVEKLSRAIFGSDGADETAIEAALKTASPEQFAEILRADHEFNIALRQAAVEEQRIAASDRADARARQTATGDVVPAVIGGIIAGFFAVLVAMLRRSLPPGAETEFSIMLGALATMTAAVVNYFFGSSAGSKEKTRLMLVRPASVEHD